MDAIQIELTTDHSIVNTGMHMLEAARQLCEHLAPAIGLLEISLADALSPTAKGRSETAAWSPRCNR